MRQRLLLLSPFLLVLLPFLLAPAVFGLLASFTNFVPAQRLVQFAGIGNYQTVLADAQFGVAFHNILVFTLAAVPAELTVGFGIAYLLREPFRGRGLVRVLLLTPWLVSPIANGVMWHFLFDSSTGLPNFWLAWLGQPGEPSPLGVHGLALPAVILSDVWRKVPLVSFLVLPGLLAIPGDIWEQATLEGLSVVDRLRHIAWPWLRPLLWTIALLLVGDALGTFDGVLVLTGGGPGSETLTPGLYSYQQAFQIHNWPIGTTSAWLIVAAILLIGLFYVRQAPAEEV